MRSLFLLMFMALAGMATTQAQDILQRTSDVDSLELPQMAPPRISYGLTAGAFVSNLGSGSYIEPRVQYHVTPRFQVFSSLMVVQSWGGPTYTTTTGEGKFTAAHSAYPTRQYLLHVGGSYAMSEKLVLSGSVWKDLNPAASYAPGQMTPFGFGQYPRQGFNFRADYHISPNVTISGGIRSGNSYSRGFGGHPMGGFYSPWGF
ncbi:hypothetical protein [Rufibacter roseus]|uniref:hypothetical protein n=1 Tax=Rufibacter roseus TaxID=1567108 RepID=UPI0012903FC2|nr:hypothetical protein [Rufibacter roseus]